MIIEINAPLIPDGDEAQRLAEQELTKSAYAAAEPTFFDRISRTVVEFILKIFQPSDGAGVGNLLFLILAAVVVIAVIVIIIVWGRPGRTFRRTRRTAPPLLGDDTRTAAELRDAAAAAEKNAQWDDAVAHRYRALARDLIERDLITPSPGATAQAIAREASVPFPDEARALTMAATVFDDVRYLRRPATRQHAEMLRELDVRLQSLHPELVA
ncbi:DUF4129 domain-containing protein [Microbacterium sp. YY-01]|uniref:DUF4129 domain-containing protein n=1 Tax=Microbacterium sp. YY-01 TaxID=3421634 RepID=UPI003D16A33C